MKYLEADFTITPYSETNADVLKALAGDGGFESFEDTPDGFRAYIQEEAYDKKAIEDALHAFPLPCSFSYAIRQAEDKDWNETWEKEGFQPVYIGENKEIVIHDTLHPDVEKAVYDILINPQLAFGTGTHETTGMLLEMLSKEDLKDKVVLDMGCGTGILGIFCCVKGAARVTAIDIDEWSVRNTLENARLNHVEKQLTALKGDASTLRETDGYDLVIANINRNILLNDLPSYTAAMKKQGSVLYLSGFYKNDIPLLTDKARTLHFERIGEEQREEWTCLKFNRI